MQPRKLPPLLPDDGLEVDSVFSVPSSSGVDGLAQTSSLLSSSETDSVLLAPGEVDPFSADDDSLLGLEGEDVLGLIRESKRLDNSSSSH